LRIAPEGWVVIVPFVVVCLVLPAIGVYFSPVLGAVLGFVSLLLIGWCLWFFRDPIRIPPPGDNLLISPADGRVLKVDSVPLPSELRDAAREVSGGIAGVTDAPVQRICIFLNVFNVHVNRVPVGGKVEKVIYTPGKFFTASLDKASEQNERSTVLLRDNAGRIHAFSQIAGLVARRIVNHLTDGQVVKTGERFGLIRFGSRAELFLPPGSSISVKAGDIVVAGESVLATLGPAITTNTNNITNTTAPSHTGAPAMSGGMR